VTQTPETQSQAEQSEAQKPIKLSSQRSIFALSVFAIGVNAVAAAYTMSPSDFALPNVSSLAELLPHQKASEPLPDPVVAALKDIQTAQQQHVVALQENSSSLQRNMTQIQQDSTALASLRQSLTDERVDVKKISAQIADEHVDVKKMSAQISALVAKIDSLQTAIAPEFTSSIPTGRTQKRLYGVVRKGMVSQSEPYGPVSVGGAPLSAPSTKPASQD
jgi:type I site-specific restriction endonuclease